MTYDPDKHHRRSIRLKEYDYSKTGAYFVTICTYNKECILGDAINGDVLLSKYGMINEIRKSYGKTVWQPRFYEHIVRNKDELDKIRQYIIDNPLQWELDKENPDNTKW